MLLRYRAAWITTEKDTILFTFPVYLKRLKGSICVWRIFLKEKGFIVISERAVLQIPPAWLSRVIAVMCLLAALEG